MGISKKYFTCKATVEKAEFKACSTTSGLMLVAVLMIHFDNFSEKFWDNMLIEHENPSSCRLGRVRAFSLAKACNLDKIPDDPSVLAGTAVTVKGAIDECGKIHIYEYGKV